MRRYEPKKELTKEQIDALYQKSLSLQPKIPKQCTMCRKPLTKVNRSNNVKHCKHCEGEL